MRITYFSIIAEVSRTYRKHRQEGLSRTDTTNKLLESYRDEISIGKEDDALLFWVALADAQYSCRELSEDIAIRGLAALDALTKTDFEITPGDIVRRRERYQKAPMPERAEIRKTQKFRCKWKLGDTFAYRLSGPHAENVGISGRYILLRKVDEKLFDKDGPIVPVVTFTLWDDKKLPENALEFQRLPLLKLENGRLGSPETHFEYRALLTVMSTRAVNQLNLLYLGNFADVSLPENEVLIDYSGYMLMVPPTVLNLCCCNYWINQKRFSSMEQSSTIPLSPWQLPFSPL